MKKCILRHPSFPLNKLDEYYNSENKEAFLLNLFHSSKLFKSTIYLYTPTLFSQVTRLVNNEISDNKKKDRIVNSLLKYFLKMTYRSTPFGTSATVSVASFGADYSYNGPKYVLKSKISSDRLYEIIVQLNSLLKEYLLFSPNNTIYIHENYYRFIERRWEDNQFNYVISKIEKSDYIDQIFHAAHSGIYYFDLKKMILRNEEFEEEDVKEFLNELIESQFLTSELGYDVFNPNQVECILNRLNSKAEYANVNNFETLINELQLLDDLQKK